MLGSKSITLTAVALFTAFVVSEVKADEPQVLGLPVPPHPVGLPIGKMVPPRLGLPVMGRPVPPTMGVRPPGMPPRPIGLPMPRPPIVGLPIIVPPHPPVGLPVGLPIPPTVGMPIFPSKSYELECNAIRGNRSGIERVKLNITTGYRTHEVYGSVRYFDGSRANINTTASGLVDRGNVDLSLHNVGSLSLQPARKGIFRHDLKGEVSLYGRTDYFGLSCDIDRD